MTREEAYKGGQKLQTYLYIPEVIEFASERLAEFNASNTSGRDRDQFFFQPVFATPLKPTLIKQ